MNFSSAILIGGRTRFIYACQRKFASFSEKKLPIFLDKNDQVINVTSESDKTMKKMLTNDKVLKILPIENCQDFHDDQLSASIIQGNIVNFYDINLAHKVLQYQCNGVDFLKPDEMTLEKLCQKYQVSSTHEIYLKLCGLIEPTFQRLLADLMENFVVIQYADPELFELNLSKWKEELKNDIFLWNLNPNVDKFTIHELIAKFPMNTKNVRHCEGQNCAHVIVNDKEETRQVFEYLNQKDTEVTEYLGKTFQTKLLHDISSKDCVQLNLSTSDNIDTVVEENFVKQVLQSMEPVHIHCTLNHTKPNSPNVKVSLKNGEATHFDLSVDSHVKIIGKIMVDKTIVKIVDSITNDLFGALRKLNTFKIQVNNIFDVGSAIEIKEGNLFTNDKKNLKSSLKTYCKSDIFELFQHFANELSDEEEKMHKDYMSMYFSYATSTNAWDYKKAKLDFKKNKNYATILVENQAVLSPEIKENYFTKWLNIHNNPDAVK